MILFETRTDLKKLSWRDQHSSTQNISNHLKIDSLIDDFQYGTLTYVEHNLVQEGETKYHKNYLSYLEECWGMHHAVVLNPDHVWYTLLCEVALIVSKNAEAYRHLFTDSEDKQDIIVGIEDSNTILPLEAVAEELTKTVPGHMTSILTEDFSTTTTRSRMARLAAFADIVSPYYNYSMFLCGIPRIRLEGDVMDWFQILAAWNVLTDKFTKHRDYFSKVHSVLKKILVQFGKPDTDFMRDIFRIQSCGSGHQTECYGWFTDFFYNQPSVRYVGNFSSHVSSVSSRNLPFAKDYEMKQGLFFSQKQDEFLVPDFGHIIYEKKINQTKIASAGNHFLHWLKNTLAISVYAFSTFLSSSFSILIFCIRGAINRLAIFVRSESDRNVLLEC